MSETLQHHDTSSSAASEYAPLGFDAERYRDQLDCDDMDDAQQAEVLAELWKLARICIDMGFGLDPVHHVLGSALKKAWTDSENSVQLEEQQNSEKEAQYADTD